MADKLNRPAGVAAQVIDEGAPLVLPLLYGQSTATQAAVSRKSDRDDRFMAPVNHDLAMGTTGSEDDGKC
ncbi:MAG: hypothetical protein DRI52_00540 [Chloroflexi bacterium]|nr:MAG: hypothetical protein DRI52_00540 [Chloroflexota bacterium]